MELRRSARLAAIQALYQMDVAQTPSKTVVFEFQNFRFGHEDEPGYVQADEPFFEALVSGVVETQSEIDPLISDRLSEKWRLSRLDRTLRAILRCATFEMSKRLDVPAKTIIDQYVGLAMDFFEARESGFVNAVLDKMARDLRADEMSPAKAT